MTLTSLAISPSPSQWSEPVIVGIGVDVVDVERFKWLVRRSPGVIDRTLLPTEQVDAVGKARAAESLAVRFAAKEAVAKALGAPPGLSWQDCEVVTNTAGRPELVLRGTVAEAASALGVTRWHLSLSHDGGIAAAYVIAEGN